MRDTNDTDDRNHPDGVHDAGDELPELWLQAARRYNLPPATPTEAMWAGIEGGLGRSVPRRTRWLGPALAAAAVLVVGIGIGRMTAPGGSGPGDPSAVAGAGAADASTVTWSPAVRAVALEHLGRSESLLALVRADARAGRVDADVGQWGDRLLAETRILLDSPAVDDPTMRTLLEDLELILAQVALLSDVGGPEVEEDRSRAELEIIARGLDEQDVLSRIQAVLPAGPATAVNGI